MRSNEWQHRQTFNHVDSTLCSKHTEEHSLCLSVCEVVPLEWFGEKQFHGNPMDRWMAFAICSYKPILSQLHSAQTVHLKFSPPPALYCNGIMTNNALSLSLSTCSAFSDSFCALPLHSSITLINFQDSIFRFRMRKSWQTHLGNCSTRFPTSGKKLTIAGNFRWSKNGPEIWQNIIIQNRHLISCSSNDR